MKRITQIFLLLVCSFISSRAIAQMADISQYDDILYCEKVKVIAGNQTYLPIVLKNNMSMRGFQFDIYLPEGCTFSLDENSSPLILPSTRLLENDMNLSSSTVRNDGSIRVICHSSIGNSLSGACGEVVRIGISVTSTMLPGDYQIVLKNIHFSDDSSHDYSIFDQPTSILEVKEIPPADDSSIIVFADLAVKNICVDNWDLNLDGELSENEAAAVSSIGQIFRNNKDIVSFEELKYFTGMTIVESFAFDGCDNLVSISLPSSIIEIRSLNTPKIQDVYIYCKKVPTFRVSNLSNIHLHVPFGTIDRYKNYYWGDWWVFASIDHIVYNLCYYIDGVLHDEKKVAYAEPISLEYPSKEGYSFSGWSGLPLIMPFHDVDVTGFFTINQYEVAFLAGGEVIKKESLDFGSTITPPEDPAMTGYTFTGWNPVPDATVPAHDVTYTAQFRANQYTITFDTDGGSEVAPITQDYNSAVNTPENPTKTGYTFAGWDREIPSTMPAEDITIKALWTINQYTITFDTDGGSEISPITQDYNTVVTAPENPTKTGYTFAGWDREIPSTMPAENITIKALWTINQYTITFDTDDGNRIKKVLESGDDVTINDAYQSLSITENIDNVNVSYSRTYKNTSWQAWYVPFGFTLTSEIADRFSFAKFAGTYTEAGQFFITLVEMQEGETIKANTPYFVQAKTADSTNPQVLNISNTTLHATDASGLKMLSAEKEIAIYGTYAKKVAAANDDWYAYGGGSYIKAKEGQNLGAFRFYLTILDRKDNVYSWAVDVDDIKVSITGTPNFIVIDGNDKKSQQEICSGDYVFINDTYKDIDITENIDNVNISYSRTYKNTSWQAWYVPFGFTLTSDIVSQFSFAKFAGTYTEAGQFFITLVKLQEGDEIKANTPYFVQAKTADSSTPQVLTINSTTLYATDASGFKMLSAEKEIAIYGTYAKKVAAADDDWYAYGGGSYIKAKEGQNLGSFRFFLTILDREDNPYTSTPNPIEIKVIVLGDEADGISGLNDDDNDNDNGTMFNLAGQPVGEGYKGVVIRNGKKFLIK